MCASCYPKPAPEIPAVVLAQTRTRAPSRLSSAPRRTGVRSGSSRSASGSAPLDDVRQQRAYHLTHIKNLPGILAAGAIEADATPVIDLSPAGLRAERAGVEIAGIEPAQLTQFVPFFLSPNALPWQSIRAKQPHPRIAHDVVGTDPADFVLLVVTVRQLDDLGVDYVVADANAERDSARFGWAPTDSEKVLRRLRAETLQESILDADLLVRGRVPFEHIALVGVAHDKARSAVRDILATADFSPKVAVYPPWFAAEVG
jgi:hypothetical protein